MTNLIIINVILIVIIVGLLILFKKTCKTERSKYFVILMKCRKISKKCYKIVKKVIQY